MNSALYRRFSGFWLYVKKKRLFDVLRAVVAVNLSNPTIVVGSPAVGDLTTAETRSSAIEPVTQQDALLRAYQHQRLAEIPGLKVQFDGRQIPRTLEGQLGHVQPSNAEEDLHELLQDLAPAYRSAGTESFRLVNTETYRRSGTKVYSLQQQIDGMPVVGAELHIQVDPTTNEAERISGVYVPDRGIEKSYSLTSEKAIHAATEYVSKQKELSVVEFELLEKPELAFIATGSTARLSWRFSFQLLFSNGTGSSESISIDANDGSVITHIVPLPVGLVRKIWGDNTIIMSEGGIISATPADIRAFSGATRL